MRNKLEILSYMEYFNPSQTLEAVMAQQNSRFCVRQLL